MAERKYRGPVPDVRATVRTPDGVGDLSGQSHDHTAFVDLDLTETSTRGAVLTACVFCGVRFNASVYSDTAFVNCVLTRCTFFDTTFDAGAFTGSPFDGCTFDLMKVTGGDWSFVGLTGARLGRAAFTGVRMREVDLAGVNCERAIFADVDRSGAAGQGARFGGADLRGSDPSSFDPLTVELRGARIDSWLAVVLAAALGLTVD